MPAPGKLASFFAACLLLASAPAQGQNASADVREFRLEYSVTTGGLRYALPPSAIGRPRIGLALAGGGAKAAAAIGVLKVLEQEGIPVKAVAGTSMGALVGGLLAAGYGAGEIESIFLGNDWNDVFSDTPSRTLLTQEQKEAGSRHLLQFNFLGGRFIPPQGLSAGQKLTQVLTARTLAASFQAGFDFDRLPLPFRAVATDLETGAPVVIGRGLLHEALRASSAIPVVFQPVQAQGRLLADGGLANNLPVDVARSLGVDLVIAVDASSKLEQKDHLSSLVEIMSQTLSLPVRPETERQAARADIVLAPDVSAYSFAAFDRMREIIRIGEESARRALPTIRAMMRRPRPGMHASIERHHITELEIAGAGRVPEDMIRTVFATALPREADADGILEALSDVYRLGYFSDVSLTLRPRGDSRVAVLSVVENPVVEAVRISGCGMVPAGEIMDGISGQLGATLNTPLLIEALDAVTARYRGRGYLLVRVEHAGMEADGKTLRIVLSEGRVDGMRFEGNRRTKDSLLRREIGTAPGSPLNFHALQTDLQRLYGLGFFEAINLDVRESGEGGVLVVLKFRERPRGTVRLGLRYDLEDSFTGLTDVVVDNLLGRGIKFFLNTRYGNYTDLSLGYHSPVFLKADFVHGVQAFYRDRTYLIYEDRKKISALDVSRSGADFKFGYQWFRFGDTYVRYRYEAVRTSEVFGAAPSVDPASIGSLAFLSTIDTRDSRDFPHAGFLFKGSYETAAETYGGDTDFRKTSLSGQGTLPLGGSHAFILDVSAGFGSGNLPFHEKFGIGGVDHLLGFPLPGYQRREFVGANALGALLAYRWKIADYQLKPVKALYLHAAAGAANVWEARDALSSKDLRKGGGIGLHADTLVGPFRLDFGAGEEGRYSVYFSAGFDF